MVFWRLVVLLITLISIHLEQSNARPVHRFAHLNNQDLYSGKVKEIGRLQDGLYVLTNHTQDSIKTVLNVQATKPKTIMTKEDITLWHIRLGHTSSKVAPLPSSVAAANKNSGINEVPTGQPTSPFVGGTCAGASNKCQDDHISMIACFFPDEKGHEESFLLVQNSGETTLMLKVNVSPANKTYENIQIPKHDVRQINISSKIRGSSSITLDAGTGKCTIEIGRSVWQGYFNNLPSYTMYVTPTNGAYLLAVTALLIGGIAICCKLRKQDRHLDGVAYQELEMGQAEPRSSMKLEISAEGWNESWDDDWDDEKAVKSPGGKTISIKLANGFDDLDKS